MAPALKIAGGFSLSEMLVVISVIILLIGIGIPAARQITDSFESSAGLRNVISAALSNARAIATKNQKYAGLRFQQDQNGRQRDKEGLGKKEALGRGEAVEREARVDDARRKACRHCQAGP